MLTVFVSLVALVFVLGVLGPVLLYLLVRSEHDHRERMDRESAERTARRDRIEE